MSRLFLSCRRLISFSRELESLLIPATWLSYSALWSNCNLPSNSASGHMLATATWPMVCQNSRLVIWQDPICAGLHDMGPTCPEMAMQRPCATSKTEVNQSQFSCRRRSTVSTLSWLCCSRMLRAWCGRQSKSHPKTSRGHPAPSRTVLQCLELEVAQNGPAMSGAGGWPSGTIWKRLEGL